VSQENIKNFQSLLPVDPGQIVELPDLSSQVRQDAEFTRPKPPVSAGQSLLAPELSAHGPLENYESRPLRRLGKDNSRHEVHFGTLVSGGADVEVAVKDCTLSWGLGEIAMNQFAAQEGLYAYAPLGLFISGKTERGNHLAHLVTAYDPEITPLDSLDWTEMDEADASLIVEDAAVAMARFHGKGLFHGDLDDRFKNFIQRTTGEVAIIDLEHTVGAEEIMAIASLGRVFGRDAEIAQGKIERLSCKDFRDLKKSLDSLPFLTGCREGRKLRIARRLLFDPYISNAEDFGSQYFKLLADAAKKSHSALRAELSQ
jgi:hypothetical protein